MATHTYINATGNTVGRIEDADGIRYFLGDDETGESFTYVIPEEAKTMLAAFGARTLATNTVSSFYHGLPKGAPKGTERKRKDEAPADDISGLADRFAAIVAGDWGATRGGGGGGVGYNLDDLLDALDSVMAESGTTINRDKVAAALREGGQYKGADLDAKAYRKQVISIEGVRAAYEALRAARQPTTSVADAADAFA